VRVHVAFTPAEAAEAPTGIVVDVLRASSTIVQALASGYKRVLCCSEVEQAEALRAELADAVVLAGERRCVRIPGFDLGNSPREFIEPEGESIVLTTTNGTRALVTAAERCDRVVVGSLMNLAAVVAAARERGENVAIVCAGVKGEFTIDDAYCAGRIAERLGGERSDAAAAAIRIAASFGTPQEGLEASQSARNLIAADLAEDIAFCARESVLEVVPRISGVAGPGVELTT
jgi:2-phosphosulfolactate phosphatase